MGLILGITGTDGSGKGTVVDYLVTEKGFTHYSARAIWMEIFKERGMEATRVNMRLVANEMRAKHGNDFVVVDSLTRMKTDKPKHAVIDSLRALAEAETLKKHGGILIAVDADPKIRYERVQARRSESDHVSYEQFLAHEELETKDPDPHGMQKRAVMALADYTIMNNGSIAELRTQVNKTLQSISEFLSR